MKAQQAKVSATVTTADGKHTIKIMCSPDLTKEVEDHILSSMKDVAVPGFRPGKATPQAIKAAHAAAVRSDLSALLVQEASQDALRLLGLDAGARPSVVDGDRATASKKWIGQFTLDGKFVFSISTPMAPPIENIDFSGLVYVPPPDDREADIQAQLDILVRDLTTYSVVSLPYGDDLVVAVSLRATEDGKEVPDMSVPRMVLGRDTGPLDAAFPDVRKKLSGLSAGDEILLKVDDGMEIFAKVEEVGQVHVPELTDDLAKSLGFESVEDIRTKITDEWSRRRTVSARADIHAQLRRQLVAKNPFDVPDAWVAEYKNGIMDMAAGAEVTEDVSAVAKVFAASDYLLELLAQRHTEATLLPQDLEAYAQIEAAIAGISVDQFMGALVRARKLPVWRRDAQKLKTLDWLLSGAQKHTDTEKADEQQD